MRPPKLSLPIWDSVSVVCAIMGTWRDWNADRGIYVGCPAAICWREIKALGYRFVALDLGGFRSGSLNEGLEQDALGSVIPVVNLYPEP